MKDLIRIERASIEYCDQLFAILNECRIALARDGIFQWVGDYPTAETVAEDIRGGHLYCFLQNDTPVGMITLNEEQDEQYKHIEWTFHGQVLIIHRLAVHPQYQKHGIARQLMNFAEHFATNHGYTGIRLDAYTGNRRSLQFYEKCAYQKRGELNFPGRTLPFYCYEKVVPQK